MSITKGAAFKYLHRRKANLSENIVLVVNLIRIQ